MSARDTAGHRWSGWPGAFCFYCGNEDSREICLADGHDLDCVTCSNPPCVVPDDKKDLIDQELNPPDLGERLILPPKT